MLVRLIETNRVETTVYAAKWMTILGDHVLKLAFLGRDVEEAQEELHDIFFTRYWPDRQYHIDKLYEELVPQLEFVDSELIRTHFLNFNHEYKIACVTEFANNGLPALPVPEECVQTRRPLTYPELAVKRHEYAARTLGLDAETVKETGAEMLGLLPVAKQIQAQREMNTQLDIEGSTLSWQAGRIQREIDGYQARYDRQVAKNATGARGERTNQYHKPQEHGYRITLGPFARDGTGLLPEDFNNGYSRLVERVDSDSRDPPQ